MTLTVEPLVLHRILRNSNITAIELQTQKATNSDAQPLGILARFFRISNIGKKSEVLNSFTTGQK